MSTKRPAVDLMSLTSDQATPMAEAIQRSAPVEAPVSEAKLSVGKSRAARNDHVPSANLEALAFKVPPSFRKRFRSRAAEADMKLNELLFAAFAAWESQQELQK